MPVPANCEPFFEVRFPYGLAVSPGHRSASRVQGRHARSLPASHPKSPPRSPTPGSQPRRPADIGLVDLLHRGDFLARRDGVRFHHPMPAERLVQRRDHGAIDPGAWRRPQWVTAVRDRLFPPPRAWRGNQCRASGYLPLSSSVALSGDRRRRVPVPPCTAGWRSHWRRRRPV